MQNARSPSYSSYLAPHFELKSRRFSHLKLVFRCELRRKKHVNLSMGSRSGMSACNRCMSRYATGCCITAQHHPQPPNTIHAIWDRLKKRPDPRMTT
jgi:hypothetical protein